MRHKLILLSIAASLLLATTVQAQHKTIVETAIAAGNFNTLVTDIECSNGVIHVIDTVLLPKMDSIPATARAAGQFNTLLAAVDAAGLAEVLAGRGPFTVFAPTDNAFAALPAGTVESLLKAINEGSAVYNAGHHSQCCDIYMETLESINSAGVEGADNHSMTVITQTLNDARDTHSMTDRAWVLRRGIDALYIRVSKMSDSMPTSDPTVR
jgi:uncharacterized surface protein with fasciclin (FAS1) repeats